MKKMICMFVGIAMLTGCTNLSPEQKEKVVDLVIKGIDIAEQVYVADAQTQGKSYTVSAATNGSVEYQIAIAYKLSKLDGSKAFEGGNTYATELRHFIVRMVELESEGKTQTPLRIKYAKVEDEKIVELMFSFLTDEGELVDETCVNCVLWE
jgi:hypothetical protein